MSATIFLGAAPASAQPAEDPAAATTTVSTSDAGMDNEIWFYGETSAATVDIPVPPGLLPDTLTATLSLPFAVRAGTLSVLQDERLISRTSLPLTDLAPVTIPLGGVVVTDDTANVTLKMTSLPDGPYCLDDLNPIGLVNGEIAYLGSELPPTTVADFLPPILRVLTIGISPAPSQAESDAAVQLAAAIKARYRNQQTRVVLAPLPADASAFDGPMQPMERRIAIKEGPDPGLSLAGADPAQLLITGPPDKLANQARLLTDPSSNMALSTTVVAGELHPATALPGDSTTLAQLSQTGLSNSGIAPQVSIALDQTRFGHPTQGFRIHVLGTFTPVPGDLGAQLTASVSGEIVDSWQPEEVGHIDHWVDVPNRLLSRYTSLTLAVETSGFTGQCNDFRPITLTVDGSSVVQSTPAQPAVPGGFLSLPQALMPRMQVGLGTQSFEDTARAVQIVVGLQQLSVVPLQTQVTSLQQAIDGSDPAILVSPDGWTDTSIALPVSGQDRQLTLAGIDGDDQETTLTLEPAIRFGSLQTVLDGQRSLLVATSNGASQQLDALLQSLSDDPRGWSSLRGSAVIAVEGQQPLLVSDRTPPTVYGPTADSEPTTERGPFVPGWLIGVGLVAAAAIGVAGFMLGQRKSRTSRGGSHRGNDGDHTA